LGDAELGEDEAGEPTGFLSQPAGSDASHIAL